MLLFPRVGPYLTQKPSILIAIIIIITSLAVILSCFDDWLSERFRVQGLGLVHQEAIDVYIPTYPR